MFFEKCLESQIELCLFLTEMTSTINFNKVCGTIVHSTLDINLVISTRNTLNLFLTG